jgi:hypothetical protein
MTRKLLAGSLALVLSAGLSACGYQGWIRYECQEYSNWKESRCQPPECVPTGTCTKDVLGEEAQFSSPTP